MALHRPASRAVISCARLRNTPRSSASIASTKALNPAHTQIVSRTRLPLWRDHGTSGNHAIARAKVGLQTYTAASGVVVSRPRSHVYARRGGGCVVANEEQAPARLRAAAAAHSGFANGVMRTKRGSV